MDPNWVPKPDHTPFVGSVWYPYRPGTLKSHKKLPENAPVKSKVSFIWHVPVGAQLFQAKSYNHFAVSVQFEHESEDVVNEDLEYFLNCWSPEIV
jgi:hypothetical protein